METTPNKHILLLEDNELNAQILQMYLGRLGMHVDWFDNGDNALNHLLTAQKNFDLILLDHQLATESGDQWIRRMRSNLPNFKVPIISNSAHLQSKEIEKNLKLGVAGFLQKPVMDKELMRLDEYLTQTRSLLEEFCKTYPQEPILAEQLYLGMLNKNNIVGFWLNYGFQRLLELLKTEEYEVNELVGLLELAKWCRFFNLWSLGCNWQKQKTEGKLKEAFEKEINRARNSLVSFKAQMHP